MQSAREIQMSDALLKKIKESAVKEGREVFVIGADLINSEDSYRMSKWLTRQTYFSSNAKIVFSVICDHAFNGKDKAWPSQERIATLSGISDRTIRRAIDELKGNNSEKTKLLHVIRRGQGKSNLYVIIFRGTEFSYTDKDYVERTD